VTAGSRRWTAPALAIVWLGIVFLLVRIATHGDFTFDQLGYAIDEDLPQVILLLGTAAGCVLFAWRAWRRRTSPADILELGWSVAVVVVGVELIRLEHNSAPVILALAILGSILSASSVVPGLPR
jgi:uncharacterized membrane protein (UPF0136 family)